MAVSKKVTDKEIISMIKERKALSQTEIEDIFGYIRGSLTSRMHRLVRENKLNLKRLPFRLDSNNHILFKGYSNKNIYFVKEKYLIEWIKDRVPVGTPKHYRRFITMKLHEIGIDIDISPRRESKLVPLSLHLHKDLKKLAKKKGITLYNMLDKIVLEYIKMNKIR